MQNGNISNQNLPVILVRLEDTILHEKNDKLTDKLKNLVIGKLNNSLVDVHNLAYVIKLSRNTDFSVILGVDPNKKVSLSTFGISNFKLKKLHDLSHIKVLLESEVITYYLDENAERISILSNERAMSIDDFRHISGVK